MKFLVIALTAACIPAAVQAASGFSVNRYSVGNKTCGDIHNIIDRDGAAIIYYRSPRSGQQRFDRFVVNDRFCQAYNYADRTYIPTADAASCPVYHCMRDDNNPGILLQR